MSPDSRAGMIRRKYYTCIVHHQAVPVRSTAERFSAAFSTLLRTVLPEQEPAPWCSALGRNRVRAVGKRSGARQHVARRGGGAEQEDRRCALQSAPVHDPTAGGICKADANGTAQDRGGAARMDLHVVRVRQARGGAVGNPSDRLVRPGVVDPKGGASAGTDRSFRGWTGRSRRGRPFRRRFCSWFRWRLCGKLCRRLGRRFRRRLCWKL
jgi:hypothetical protein